MDLQCAAAAFFVDWVVPSNLSAAAARASVLSLLRHVTELRLLTVNLEWAAAAFSRLGCRLKSFGCGRTGCGRTGVLSARPMFAAAGYRAAATDGDVTVWGCGLTGIRVVTCTNPPITYPRVCWAPGLAEAVEVPIRPAYFCCGMLPSCGY